MHIVGYLLARGRTIRGRTIIHVGAHTGQEAARYQFWGARRVIWVEAAPDIFLRLERHLAAMRMQPLSLFARLTNAPRTEHVAVNALIAAEDGVVHDLNVYDNDGASNSIYRIARDVNGADRYSELRETGDVHRITARTLDSILLSLKIPASEVDILVVDTQGAELLCLKGATTLLKHVRWIEAEVSRRPVYAGGVLLHELEAWLAERSFRRRSRAQSNHTDVVFERSA